MRTIIAGSRTARMGDTLIAIESCPWEITAIVSGAARGPDSHAIAWGECQGLPLYVVPANWARWPKAAGPIRNGWMLKIAEALVAVWDGQSRGTKDMIDKARRAGLSVHVHRVGAE